jgi:hypothetical protein
VGKEAKEKQVASCPCDEEAITRSWKGGVPETTPHPTVLKKPSLSWVWWRMPVIPALGRGRQEDCKFEASLGGIDFPPRASETPVKSPPPFCPSRQHLAAPVRTQYREMQRRPDRRTPKHLLITDSR